MSQKDTKEFEDYLKSKVTEITNNYQQENASRFRREAERENAKRLQDIERSVGRLLGGWLQKDEQYLSTAIKDAQNNVLTRLVDDLRINGMFTDLRTSPTTAQDDEEPDSIKIEEKSESESPKVKSTKGSANSKATKKAEEVSSTFKPSLASAEVVEDIETDEPTEQTKLHPPDLRAGINGKKAAAKPRVPASKDKNQQAKLDTKFSEHKKKVAQKPKTPSTNDDQDDEDDKDIQEAIVLDCLLV